MKLSSLAKSTSTVPRGSIAPKTEAAEEPLLRPAPVRILDLPHELLLQIIDVLDDATLCDLGTTCRDLNNLIFPFFFEKHQISSPTLGWISCYRPPHCTLRAVRCSLSAGNIYSFFYYFNKGLDQLLEEIEEMYALVKRADKVTHFSVFLLELDEWARSEAPHLDEAQVPRLTEEEWTKLYLGLLTASLTKGCKEADLSGGYCFLKYLQTRDQTIAEHDAPTDTVLPLRERLLGKKRTRYDEHFRYTSHFACQPKQHVHPTQSVERTPLAWQAEGPEGRCDNHPTSSIAKESRKRPRLMKWVGLFPTRRGQVETSIPSRLAHNLNNFKLIFSASKHTKGRNNPSSQSHSRTSGPPQPMIQNLLLHSDMLFASPSFLDWTIQLLAWCAPTLTHLGVRWHETPSDTWSTFFPKLELPALSCFEITCSLIVGGANTQGSDLVDFLSRHPGIQKLYLHKLPIPTCISALPRLRLPILPNLTKIIAHPTYVSWLLLDQYQYPELKEVILQTECSNTNDMDRPFAYDAFNEALVKLLPHSHKLDVLGFRFSHDHDELDAWLQSHVDAGLSGSILFSFNDTRRLQINSAHCVRIIDGKRLGLVAQFIGLFPNLEYLELQNQMIGAPYQTVYVPLVVKALRKHSPLVKKVKINGYDPIDIASFDQSKVRA